VTAPQSFATLAEARAHLATVEADLLRRTYRAPRKVTETLAEYGAEWIEIRPGLKDSTRHQYGIDFSRHVEPYLGERLLDKIEPEHVRRWHARLTADLKAELGPSGRTGTATVARCYRLLRAILQTAVDDELLLRNPCRLPGAGMPKTLERPVLSLAEVGALAGAVPEHYRAYVVLAALSGLRAGELAALRVRDCALGPQPSVRVARRFYRVAGRVTVDTPKSEAGSRVVPVPQVVAVELRAHLAAYRQEAGPDDLVFVTIGGRDVLDTASQVVRRGLDRIGRPDARAHDLRHTALTAAAEHGATIATLMQMAGHSTSVAAQRYQHATLSHARQVAAAVHASAAAALARPSEPARAG
jgi:integrase